MACRGAPGAVRLIAALAALLAAAAAFGQGASTAAAERLFRQGLLPSGAPLVGERDNGIRVEGAAAACAGCHRRSGLGTAEGFIAIPPITGQYLFRAPSGKLLDVDFLRSAQGFKVDPQAGAYTDETLARAIREGVGRGGRPLNYLMPRYDLDDATTAELVAYLKHLSAGPAPGVTADTLHFATIVTPDADPVKRQAMLDVLERFFADKNEFLRGGERPMHSPRGVKYRVSRKWQLHVWELTGAPESWEAQLRRHLAEEPVFAVISGIGGRTWAPIHRFCEAEALPCLMPNVDLPVVAERDFYDVYPSGGVLLEAQLVGARLAGAPAAPGGRLIQVYRRGDVGEDAARALAAALPPGAVAEQRAVAAKGGDLSAALAGVRADDTVVLWLRPPDLAKLPPAPAAARIFVSGIMAGLEHAPLAPDWRRAALMTYPFDLPDGRRVRMNFPLGWLKVRRIPIVDERVQADTYLACGILAENITDMLDSFVRDYLLERVEVMLTRRQVTGYYPRLSLAQGQRLASRGGYLVRFAGAEGPTVAADGGWVVP